VLSKTATSEGVGVVRGCDNGRYLLQDCGAAGLCTPHVAGQLKVWCYRVNVGRSESVLHVDRSEKC